MTKRTLPAWATARTIRGLLDLPATQTFLQFLETLQPSGRRGYTNRARLGMVLIKYLYEIPEWTKVVHLVDDHERLQQALGCADPEDVPSKWACYRFFRKLAGDPDLLKAFDEIIVAALIKAEPRLAQDAAIDATDMPAYANGQRYIRRNGPERKEYSDPDASWGHRSAVSTRGSGGYYGYKLHAGVSACRDPQVPEAILAHQVATARTGEGLIGHQLIETLAERGLTGMIIADSGYDGDPIATRLESHHLSWVIARNPYKPKGSTTAVELDYAPTCKHSPDGKTIKWLFKGADYTRRATKWKCPTGECTPKSVWKPVSRRYPLIPYASRRWKRIYKRRTAVERAFGRLKRDHGLTDLRVRRLHRVSAHATLVVVTYNLMILLRL